MTSQTQRLFVSLAVIAVLVAVIFWLKVPLFAKVLYASLTAVLVFYLINSDFLLLKIRQAQSQEIRKFQDSFYKKYEREYKDKYPGTLEFITARNLGHIPIYYINLDRSPERRARLEADFRKYGIEARRVSGVDGRRIANTKETAPGPNLKRGEVGGVKYRCECDDMSAGEIGCTLSHLEAISRARRDGHQLALIFEDDVGLDLIPHWERTLPQLIETMPSDWSIINLNPTCVGGGENNFSSYGRRQCNLTTAYLVNRRGMENMARAEEDGAWVISRPKFGRCRGGAADCFVYAFAPGGYSYTAPLFFAQPGDSTVGSSESGNVNNAFWRTRNFGKNSPFKK